MRILSKKWLKAIGAATLSLSLLAGCGAAQNGKEEATAPTSDGGGEAAETFTVGVTQIVEHPSLDAAFEGFQNALKENGLDVEYNVQIAQGDMNNSQTIATNFVGDNVDLIFANSTPSAQSALNATDEIPIVFTSVTDPVGASLVEAMDTPGVNITGTTDTHPDAIPNTVKFIDENFDAKKIGMVFNAGEQNSVAQVDIVKKAVEGTDLEVVERPVSTSAEVKQATESLVGVADVIYIITDNTVVSALESVILVASDEDIPLFVGELDSVERGGFAAYGFNYYDIGHEAGEMAAQILKGEKTTSELPVQYPQNLKLLINKQAANDMGIELKPEWESMAEFTE
ncbi:ABC transporter substrate-binding protein [Bacillus solimangrovi]|uniref:BMP family ABC transporter substrate-binding protein n=1 Tax=Bacillus solimangrovi TaxID=1305675 RepID=A0A1E5LEA3_9BACI|nr:ABC transporter substrate-binding protein [Bacillus solimangrovi]OEH92413.1 BMP family ABC transporter substrate-binding protein [Bacillus solimangrovi]